MLSPERHIETGPEFAKVDLREWSDTAYTYEPDSFGLVGDVLTPPTRLLAGAQGDCEDYAFFAASVLAAQGVTDIDLVSMWKPGVGHVVCEANGRTYSSGNIFDYGAGAFARDHGYLVTVRRPRVEPAE